MSEISKSLRIWQEDDDDGDDGDGYDDDGDYVSIVGIVIVIIIGTADCTGHWVSIDQWPEAISRKSPLHIAQQINMLMMVMMRMMV